MSDFGPGLPVGPGVSFGPGGSLPVPAGAVLIDGMPLDEWLRTRGVTNQYDQPFPVTGSVPGAWQGHPVWADSGPTIRETSYDPLVPGWAAQDPNGFVIPFEGIAPISPIGLWGNGFTVVLTGTLLGTVSDEDGPTNPELPILTVPPWARPGDDWTLDGCAAFRVRWAYQDDTEPYAWHVVRTDENVVGQINADGELTIPGGWPTAPPDGATSILLDLGVVAWYAGGAPKAMPVGWAHRAKTEILDSDTHVAADAGTIVCDGLANLWTAGGGHAYQDGMQVHVLTGAASVMVSDYESDEPFLDPAGVAVHSYLLPAHTHAVLSRSNGAWRLSVLGANQNQTVPVTPADEAATTAPTWYQSDFDGAQRISGIIAAKVDLGEGVIATVTARVARATALDGAWSDKWYMTGVQTFDGTTWASGTTLVSPVDPDNPTIFDLLTASPLPAMAITPTDPSHAANKGYVDDALHSGLALGSTSSTAHRGDHGATAYTHSQTSGNPHGTTAADVGAATSGHDHSGVYEAAGAAVLKSLVDAAGDLFLGTAPDTVGRLAIGAARKVLTSDGSTAAWGLPAGPSPAMLPVAVGAWFANPHDAVYDQATTLNRVYYVPIWIPWDVNGVDGVQVQIATVGSSGALLRLGLHLPHATTGFPDARAVDAGTADATSGGGAAGVRSLTFTAVPVTPNTRAYVSVVSQGAVCTLKFANSGQWLTQMGVASSTNTDVMRATSSNGWFEAGVSGAFGSTASPTYSSSTAAQVVVGLRRSS